MKPSSARRMIVASCVVGLVAGALALTQPLGAVAVEGGWIDDAIRFRGALGFEADRAFVDSTFAREGYSADEFRVPLSKAEVAVILDRQARTAQATVGHAWAHKQPGWAGAWTDQLRDGMIIYQFTQNVAAARQELEGLLPSPVKYEVRRVDRDLDALNALKCTIVGDIDKLMADGIDVISVGLDIRDNTVIVGVAGDASRERDAIKARYGESVKVMHDELGQADVCNELKDCPPLKGGIRVFDVPGDGDCTAGYVAQKPNGRLVLVTAGHCIWMGDQGNNWKHKESDPVQGTADKDHSIWCCTNRDNRGADVGFFLIDTDQEPASKTKVAIGNQANLHEEKIRRELQTWSPQQEVGEMVCRMGWGSRYQDYSGYQQMKCGDIVYVGVERKSSVEGYAVRWVDGLNVWEGDSTGGDSGGTMFVDVPGVDDEVYLLGTHVHSSDDNPGADGYSWYEPVTTGILEISLEHDLVLDPCTLDDPC